MFTVLFLGKQNVGKSSLINAIVRRPVQLVSSIPGTTVDLVYKLWQFEDFTCFLVDSEGLIDYRGAKELLERVQCNLVVFVLDYRVGLASNDIDFYRILKSSYNSICVVNKVDSIKDTENLSDFYSLGEFLPVSAKTGFNLSSLRKQILEIAKKFPKSKASWDLSVGLIGRTNVGKSSLLNSLVKKNVSKVDSKAHTTRDFIEQLVKFHQKTVRVIDFAGFLKGNPRKELEKRIKEKFKLALNFVDVCALVIDASTGVSSLDRRLFNFLLKAGKPCIVVANKSDQRILDRKTLENFFPNAFVVFTSALTHKNTSEVLNASIQTWMLSRKTFSDDTLFEIAQQVFQALSPPLIGSKLNALISVKQLKSSPPTFVLYFKKAEALPSNYIRQFEKKFIKNLGLKSYPVVLEFKSWKSKD